MQHSHLIIADDFTGALDTGVQFLQADLSTTFVLQESYEIADAHVFSSESRNVDEAMRMVDALRFFEEKGEVCPANWEAGKDGLKDTHEGVASYLAKH